MTPQANVVGRNSDSIIQAAIGSLEILQVIFLRIVWFALLGLLLRTVAALLSLSCNASCLLALVNVGVGPTLFSEVSRVGWWGALFSCGFPVAQLLDSITILSFKLNFAEWWVLSDPEEIQLGHWVSTIRGWLLPSWVEEYCSVSVLQESLNCC